MLYFAVLCYAVSDQNQVVSLQYCAPTFDKVEVRLKKVIEKLFSLHCNEFYAHSHRNPPVAAFRPAQRQAADAGQLSAAEGAVEDGFLLSEFSKRYVADFRAGVFCR